MTICQTRISGSGLEYALVENDENRSNIAAAHSDFVPFFSLIQVPVTSVTTDIVDNKIIKMDLPEQHIAGQPILLSISKPTTQVGGSYSEAAVDGVGNEGNCAKTDQSDDYVFWQVDLQTESDLDTVEITNPKDCCNEDLADFYIYARKDDKTDLRNEEEGKCGPIQGAFSKDETKRFVCMLKNVRYVTIWRDTSALSNSKGLTLCEVSVYGYHSSVPRRENNKRNLNLDITMYS